jgi:hypothetical protein
VKSRPEGHEALKGSGGREAVESLNVSLFPLNSAKNWKCLVWPL